MTNTCLNFVNKNYLIIVPILIIAASCSVKIKDFNPAGSPVIAVAGFVSDSGNHLISITRTQQIATSLTFTTPGLYVNGSEAVVVVTDGEGLVDTFQFSSNPIEPYFKPSKTWNGVPGRTYTMTAVVDGKTYTASDQMPNYTNFKVDSLYPVYRGRIEAKNGRDTVSLFDLNQFGFFRKYISIGDSLFLIRIVAPVLASEEIFVRTLLFNDLGSGFDIPYNNPTRVFVTNSTQAALEKTFIIPPAAGPPTLIYFKRGQQCTIVLQTLSKPAFSYFSGLNSALVSDGGLFSAPPGNPPNNISNGGLGFFYCSQTLRYSFKVQPLTGPLLPSAYKSIPNPAAGFGDFKFVE